MQGSYLQFLQPRDSVRGQAQGLSLLSGSGDSGMLHVTAVLLS